MTREFKIFLSIISYIISGIFMAVLFIPTLGHSYRLWSKYYSYLCKTYPTVFGED